jgi:hypothetical protein
VNVLKRKSEYSTAFAITVDSLLVQWEAINHKQITRWQHVSQLKASSFGSWKKIIIVKNATAYTWDWYCHLVVDRASLQKRYREGETK